MKSAGRPAMRKDNLYLIFDDMSNSVELINCRHLIDFFPLIFSGWHITEVSAEHSFPVLSLRLEDNNYVLESDWLEKPAYRENEDAAICLLVAELMRAYVHEDRQLLCLHGAAAEFDGKLVLFPSNYRAGKSILSACLAASGVRLFSDDVLPISLPEAEGIAPGFAPRLRLPLPDNLGSVTREFISKHNRLQGEQYLYLDLENDLLAPRGSQLPVGALVLLEREEGASPVMETVAEAEVLRQVIWQNFARETEAPRILGVLSELVASSQRFRLRYDRAEDAVRLLRENFSDWSTQSRNVNHAKTLADGQTVIIDHLLPGHYLRNPDISIAQIEDQVFLADGQGATIHYLNPIGAAIWSLLAEPMTADEITNLLMTAFPDLERGSIESDLHNLIDELLSRNLLLAGS
jgi:hypothetical protein